MYEAFEPFIKAGKKIVQSSPSLFKDFEKLYIAHLGIAVCTSCPGDGGFDTAWGLFETLYNNHFNKSKKMETLLKDFEFKPGHIPYSAVSHKHYGAANSTDTDCVRLLGEAEGNLVHFAKFPADWKDRVKKQQAKDAVKAEKKAEKPAAVAPLKVVAPVAPVVAPEASTAGPAVTAPAADAAPAAPEKPVKAEKKAEKPAAKPKANADKK